MRRDVRRCSPFFVTYTRFLVTVAMATSEEAASKNKEGTNLLGAPTFTELENGRFKCVETGHELLAKDKESYAHSKRCRLVLIDFFLSRNKPPLNMFKQDPLSRSKLICNLTGDTINKSEEHIWKHINGKRFLNKLEEREAKKLASDGTVEEQVEQKPQKASKPSKGGLKKKKKKDTDKVKDKGVDEIISEVRNLSDQDSDSEEADFWMPPVGERWDLDDGGDRWGSGSESGQESEEVNGTDGLAEEGGKEGGKETEELSTRYVSSSRVFNHVICNSHSCFVGEDRICFYAATPCRTKRMSIEIGPSSFASRKKKSRKNHAN